MDLQDSFRNEDVLLFNFCFVFFCYKMYCFWLLTPLMIHFLQWWIMSGFEFFTFTISLCNSTFLSNYWWCHCEVFDSHKHTLIENLLFGWYLNLFSYNEKCEETDYCYILTDIKRHKELFTVIKQKCWVSSFVVVAAKIGYKLH